MAAILRANDVCDFGVRTAEGVRKLHRELIMSVRLKCWYASRKLSRASRDGWRVSEYGHGFPRRTHGQDSKITITKKAAVPLSLKIRKNLDGPIRIRAKCGPGLHAAIHVTDAIVIGNIRIVPRLRISHVSAHRHKYVRMSSNQPVPQCNAIHAADGFLRATGSPHTPVQATRNPPTESARPPPTKC